jgi:hypothetical protein
MKERQRKQPAESSDQDDSRAFYVYCIGESEALRPLFDAPLPEAIESTGGLELVSEGVVAAVVSAVPRADYSDEGLDSRVADPSWMASRAMRHQKVAEHFAAHTSLVPLRFGAIYSRLEPIRRMLAERESELVGTLDRLRGREEWGINIFGDRARLVDAVSSLSPKLRDLEEQAARASPGQSYLVKKKIIAIRGEEAIREGRRLIEQAELKLKAVSEEAVRLRVLKGETSEGEITAKLAFLVTRERFAEFRAVAEELADEYGALGFRLELSGPWPAYNFASGQI